MKIERVTPLGRTVLCDICGEDWTDRTDGGGMLFGSKAVCPTCTPDLEESAANYGETHFIRGRPEEGESFADWCRRIRGPDAVVRVTTGTMEEIVAELLHARTKSEDR